MKAIRRLCLLALATAAIAPQCALAAAGDLDPLDANVVGRYVTASAVQPDGKTIIAGNFTSVLGVPRNNIARFNADGTLDTGFNPNANGPVSCVAVQADGKILLGGGFFTLQPNGAVGTTPRQFIARVNADGTLDTGFDPNANSTVFSVAVQADGKILLGGFFTTLQPNGATVVTTRNRIARVNADGTVDPDFDPNANGYLYSVAVQADGKILLGGFFTTLQPNGATVVTTRNRIARVNADGTVDPDFDPNANSSVFSVAVQADGKILLGGAFDTLQPNGAPSATPRNRIARVNADGTLDTGFDPSANGTVYSVAVQADGKILLGGIFRTLQPNGAVSPTQRNKIARVNADGTLDTGFDPNSYGDVYGVALQADGKILLGGFSGGSPTYTTSLNNDAAIQSLSGTQVYSGGSRTYGTILYRYAFARLNNDAATQSLGVPSPTQVLWQRGGAAPDVSQVTFELSTNGGTTWAPLPGTASRVGATADWQLTGLSLPASGQLRARGRTAGGMHNGSSGIVQQVEDFGPAGSLAASLDANIVGSSVYASAAQPDGKTIIAGYFTSVLGVARNNIARLNADGTLDTGFDPNANDAVYSVAVLADGKILLGGDFTTLRPNGAASPTTRNRIARLNADGTLDPGFNPEANGRVYSVAVQADGKILLGGVFTTLQPNGAAVATPRQFIARVNADGTLDPGFNLNADNVVNSVAVQADGKILLGGVFGTLWPPGVMFPTPRNFIARVNADGTLDPGFNPKADHAVNSVAVQADGKILLGGWFNTLKLNGGSLVTRNRIARVNADGTLDTGFDPNANGLIYSVAVQADGKILLGGAFTSLQPNGAAVETPRQFIARVNADGTLDTGFDPKANSPVNSVAVQADGKILLGGFFTTLQPNGAASPTTRNVFARLNNDAAFQSLGAPSATQVLWQRGGAAPDVSQVTFELSTNGGTTWSPLPGTASRLGATANWQLTGLSLPASGQLRARGRTAGGYLNGSSSIVEQVAGFSGPGAAGWRWAQLTTVPNAADGARTGAAHPGASLYFYKGTDSNIWTSFWNGTQWAQSQLTSDANVDDWLSYGTSYGLLAYKGKDNKLWTLYFNGSVWTKALLGSSTNVAGDVTVDDTWNLIHYRGTDSRVWTARWTGGLWETTSLGGAGNVVGGLAVDPLHHLIYYQGSGNEMWCYFWTGTAWVQCRMANTFNVGGAVAADTAGSLAYYRSSADNSAWCVYWNGSEWAQTQLDAAAGIGTANAIAPLRRNAVLYLNNNGQCYAEFWNGSSWGRAVLGDGGAGLTGGLSVQRSTNLAFARRADGQVVVFYFQ